MKSSSFFAACLLAIPLAKASAATTPLAHVEVRGDGDTALVLIPGLGTDWSIWNEFMERNEDDYTMYAVTLPGMAGSEAPPAPAEEDTGTPWVENAVEAIADMINQRELDGAIVVGHSLGGHIAAQFGITHPELCAKVVSIDGYPVAPIAQDLTGDARRQAIEAGFVAQIKAMATIWYDQFAKTATVMVQDQDRASEIASMMASTEPDVAMQYIIELFRADIREELLRTDAPTLFIAAIPEEEGAGLGRDFWIDNAGDGANVSVVFIERSRHFIMDDQPEELDKAIAEWVK